MSEQLKTLMFVCTANICRSPVAAEVFVRELSPWLGKSDLPLSIISRGTHAISGDDRCVVASGRFQIDEPGVSAIFEADDVSPSTLVLTMEQGQIAYLVQTFPKLRSQIFTLPQAVEIAQKIYEGIIDGSLFTSPDPEITVGFVAPPLPEDVSSRWNWLLNELDANRGLATTTNSSLASGDLDIADAHKPDGPTHELALDLIEENVKALAILIQDILSVNEFSEVSAN